MTVTHHKPDYKEKIFFFLSGILTSIPLTLFVGEIFEGYLCVVLPIFYSTLCSTAIAAPLIEEFTKAYPLFYRHGESEKSIVTLGILVGLGFGVSEFFVYVTALGVPIFVRVPGVLFHAASTSITAYGIAKKRPIKFYLTAVFLHFLNNFSALFGPLWLVGGVIALMITISLSWQFYRIASESVIVI